MPELHKDFQHPEIPDEVYVEVDSDWAQCPRTRRSSGGGLVLCGKHLLHSCCQQQHTISLSSAEAQSREHRERRSSRTLHSERASGNGAESSCARVNRLECSRWKHFETWRRASDASGDPERHHKLIKVHPLSVPGTRRGVANSVALEMVCSLLPVRATAGNSVV